MACPRLPEEKILKTPAEATKHMIHDGFRKYTKAAKLGTDKSKVLYFLYGRGFFFGSRERKNKIESILRHEEALQRAVRLVNHDGDRDVTSEFQNQYRTLCQTLKGYIAQPGAFGIPLPTTEDEKTPLQYYFRFQKQGNCFLLAPCLAVGYLMQLKNIDGAAPLDLTQYVRHSFDDEKLFRYLADDSGGDAVKEFETMIAALGGSTSGQLHTLPIDMLNKRDCKFGLKQRLQSVGPGLVSNFKVHKNFLNPGCDVSGCGYMRFSENGRLHSNGEFIQLPQGNGECDGQHEVSLQTHLENLTLHPKALESNFNATHNEDSSLVKTVPTGDGKRKELETHAMLVIGGRYDGNKLWFLLQNWWQDMQLVEVSAEYLTKCKAKISFVSDSFKFADEDERAPYSVNTSLVADANNFDRAERKEGGLSPPTMDRT